MVTPLSLDLELSLFFWGASREWVPSPMIAPLSLDLKLSFFFWGVSESDDGFAVACSRAWVIRLRRLMGIWSESGDDSHLGAVDYARLLRGVSTTICSVEKQARTNDLVVRSRSKFPAYITSISTTSPC